MNIEDFYTVDAASEGVKLPLKTPDGQDTEHYLIVRGMDCPELKEVQRRYAKMLAKMVSDKGGADAQKYADLKEQERRDAIASLVAGWSFDAECTEAKVKELLEKAPQISEAVDKFAGDREAFFTKRRELSQTGQETK